MNDKLMIGWSEADITPDACGKKIPLYGQYYTRLATGIHSRLKTVACAISRGDSCFINAGIDNAGCPKQFLDRLKEEVAKLDSSIDTSKIFVNAIHTHSAPSLAFQKNPSPDTGVASKAWHELRDQMLTPEEYADFAIPVIAGNIVSAWQNRRPGGIASGFGNARIGHCRRAVYADGTAENLVTDTENWKTFTFAPVLMGDIFNGETYDARISDGWKYADYDTAGWLKPVVSTDFSGTSLAIFKNFSDY